MTRTAKDRFGFVETSTNAPSKQLRRAQSPRVTPFPCRDGRIVFRVICGAEVVGEFASIDEASAFAKATRTLQEGL